MCAPHRRPGVHVDEHSKASRAISDVPTSIAAFVGRTSAGPPDQPTEVRSWGEYEATFGSATPGGPLGRTVRSFFDNGGATAVIVRRYASGSDRTDPATGASAPLITPEDYLGRAVDGSGMYALERTGGFNLLSIPPDAADGDVPGAVYAAAAQLCVAHGATLLVDPPTIWARKWQEGRVSDISVADLGTSFSVEQARNAAVYFPRLRIADPSDGTQHIVAPSGAVAGVFASTDATQGVWKVPAGIEATLGSIAGLEVDVDDAGQSMLNPAGINCLRALPGRGTVVWGGRTLRGAVVGDEFRYINVRRLSLFIEESIRQGTEWAALEPNEEPLWRQLRRSVERFLGGLFRRGAFTGATPRDAYFVKCGRDTMTEAEIREGRVKLLVGIAPMRPAEFVILRVELRAG